MNSVFVDQTYLQIILTSGVNIVGAKTAEIHYRKPNGVLGSLTAEVTDAASGILRVELEHDSALLDVKGKWKFWNYIVFSDDRAARGESVEVEIFDKNK